MPRPPLNKSPKVSCGGLFATAAALLAPLFSGCQTWPYANSPAASETTSTAEAGETTPKEKAASRPIGRSPISSTGFDDRSREIERNLGAR